MRSLQEAVKSEDLSIVPRGGFEIHSKILRRKELIQSAALILSASFVSATLSNINIFAIIVQRRNHAYLRGFDGDLVAVAEEPEVYESV
ncbi:hypothetical protein OCU04_008490 [Sclerotinia nivalis]|uniref:Uncharacterized protein n=1 Tax=Sclerotinia nivalis TaxID=352851 RepID=A0A9X0DHN6_9HELO|nr:hypothetical protein OCU04_008490 [Sclerotinia nivalis]